jgi:hypothetical protein
MTAAIKDGDDPAIVAKVIVAAATNPKPKLRYTDACSPPPGATSSTMSRSSRRSLSSMITG